MRLLLDTHAFIWWVLDDRRLSNRSRELIGDRANDVLVSAATAYEIAVKAARGRLTLPEPPETYVPSRMAGEGFAPLPVQVAHAVRAGALPPIHRDPWDRLLIAQAQLDDLPILSADPAIGRYDVETIW
ncbi:MAG TPA: type II toxin-antitoxin system VapC family toxin [Candidatus Limnocylindrales bacterium]|nr:type II toxin-antitoxin system VapC family toxin [Candidatus Limnocylindrales bacterium]